MQMKMHIVPT